MNLELAGAEIPVSALSCFDTLAILALVPVFDQVIYPYCKKIGYPLSMLQKIGEFFLCLIDLFFAWIVGVVRWFLQASNIRAHVVAFYFCTVDMHLLCLACP